MCMLAFYEGYVDAKRNNEMEGVVKRWRMSMNRFSTRFRGGISQRLRKICVE